jgi:nitroimidazol reductase NimA-like FMN-containing flavoprotein (pyridoxamine 5'-phosphate oxidase superfamily)
MPENSPIAPTARTKVRRLAKRGVYDRAVIDAILDEAFICQVGFLYEGKPCVLPTAYTRVGHWLYLHGAQSNRMLRAICGQEACVSVTLLDGLVLARSAFHHSINYRSVVVFGEGEEVTDHVEKLEAMERLVEHIVPGRWAEARQPNEQELDATLIVRLPTDECSAKVRIGPPVDDEVDLALDVWAGVLPVTLAWGEPLPDSSHPPRVAAPDYLLRYRRPTGQP